VANVVEAEGFVVKDSRGVVRARLGLIGEGQEYAGLSLYDQEGQSRVLVSTASSGSYDRATVLIKDADGAFRAKLNVSDGISHLLLCDAGEIPRVRLSCGSAGGTLVEVLNADGTVAFSTRQGTDD
jgi:hypothetical protein